MNESSGKGSEFVQKRVDESWKDTVRKEKELGVEETPEAAPTVDFLSFVSTLAMQCLMFLGEIAAPGTNEPQTDLRQARYLIDVIQMLSEKTQKNLSDEERAELDKLLYELRVKFIRKNQMTGA